MYLTRFVHICVSPLRSALRFRRALKAPASTRRGVNQAAAQIAAVSATGATRRVTSKPDLPDLRRGVLFKVFECPDSDEPTVDRNDLASAAKMADCARQFYKLRADLFPPDNLFYEQVEGGLIDRVSRIDNGGEKDQFVATLDLARRISNDNTRKLMCQVAPAVLGVMLFAYATVLVLSGLPGLQSTAAEAVSAEGWRLAAGAIILTAGMSALALIYLFSYTHIQRANALNLNAFIATEFAHLNNTFLVAQREALQAETQLADTQKDQLRRLASSWTLAYHWIGVRQFLEEMFVRNVMFQIRRNTSLYATLGVLSCAGLLVGATLLAWLAESITGAQGTVADVLHLLTIASAFVFVTYGLTARRPFSIIATALMKDQWYRYDTMSVGDAIAEQVTRDKVQIVINRDRARAAGI
jgi:hypothetical protein